ncbi:hypothetical protein N8Z24_00235 [bacterium]|nr:hypothetical protein [bacterium]
MNAGFFVNSLNLVSNREYSLPVFNSGEEFINYFVDNLDTVENRGLCLYIWSKEKGSGKTTLAHHLMYHVANYYSEVSRYSTNRKYGFEHVEDFVESFKDRNNPNIWKSTWYVLDDLGNEDRSAKWKKDSITANLPRVFHHRRNYNLPTIITSNYSPGDLSRLYESELDSLLEIKPDGTLGGSKFREVCVCGVTDFRLEESLDGWDV